MSERMAAHGFHALWYGFGPYGPQDVHVHPCSKDGHGPNDDGPQAGCSEVLLGYDRQRCNGRIEEHERANLDDPASVDRAARRLRPQVMAAGSDADRLVRQKVSSEYARAHDLLDRYQIPRFTETDRAEDDPRRELDLSARIVVLVERIRVVVTPKERARGTVDVASGHDAERIA